jgi:hypothetical protein
MSSTATAPCSIVAGIVEASGGCHIVEVATSTMVVVPIRESIARSRGRPDRVLAPVPALHARKLRCGKQLRRWHLDELGARTAPRPRAFRPEPLRND